MTALKPWNINNLAVGAVRILYAPTTQAVPTKIQDIIAMTSPYAPVGLWKDFGAGKEASSYARGMEAQGLQIQQESGDIMSEITQVSRSMTASIAEIQEDNWKVVENASTIETIAAASGASAQKGLPVGAFSDLSLYRIAMIATRKSQSGLVNEPGGAQRGRMVCVALYRASLSADDAETSFAKGELISAQVQFESFPEPGQPAGQEFGKWLFEAAGTIT